MKHISSVILFIMMPLLIAGCESNENKSLDEEIQNNTDQLPENFLQNIQTNQK